MRKFIVVVGALLALVLVANTASATTVVVDWSKAAVAEVRRNPKLGPPVVARMLAIAQTCVHDAWTGYDKKAVGDTFNEVGKERRPRAERTTPNKRKAVSFAAYRCLINLFPDQAAEAHLNLVMRSLGYNPSDMSSDNSPAGIGNRAAAAVIESRRHDGSNQYGDLHPGAYSDYTGYAPRNRPLKFCIPTIECPPFDPEEDIDDPLHWQPLVGPAKLGSVVQKFVAPHWERVRPFALLSADQFDHLIPEPEVLRSKELYRKNAKEILGHSAKLTPWKKLLIEYWADGPNSEYPPGHWALLAQFVSKRDKHTIDQDVKMFFLMHRASADAGIVTWHIKRKYDSVRPITAIRYLFADTMVKAWGGPDQPIEYILGKKWSPYNPGQTSNLSPAFPAFISGHAAFSEASKEALRHSTGSNYFGYRTIITANFGQVERGIPRVPTAIKFKTFSQAAKSATDSRVTSGIHFDEDCRWGRVIGKLVGQYTVQQTQKLFNGIPAR